MRWKLLIITSLGAALLSAGGCLALIYWAQGRANPDSSLTALTVTLYSIPLVFITLAAVFVYRHTARRRKQQALLSLLLSMILTLTALYAVTLILDRPTPAPRWHLY
jgi:hypothetical protein